MFRLTHALQWICAASLPRVPSGRRFEWTRYWAQLFSHNRLGVWKGMLRIDLDTQTDDIAARTELTTIAP